MAHQPQSYSKISYFEYTAVELLDCNSFLEGLVGFACTVYSSCFADTFDHYRANFHMLQTVNLSTYRPLVGKNEFRILSGA